eukprot:scaffold9.g3205.t1
MHGGPTAGPASAMPAAAAPYPEPHGEAALLDRHCRLFNIRAMTVVEPIADCVFLTIYLVTAAKTRHTIPSILAHLLTGSAGVVALALWRAHHGASYLRWREPVAALLRFWVYLSHCWWTYCARLLSAPPWRGAALLDAPALAGLVLFSSGGASGAALALGRPLRLWPQALLQAAVVGIQMRHNASTCATPAFEHAAAERLFAHAFAAVRRLFVLSPMPVSVLVEHGPGAKCTFVMGATQLVLGLWTPLLLGAASEARAFRALQQQRWREQQRERQEGGQGEQGQQQERAPPRPSEVGQRRRWRGLHPSSWLGAFQRRTYEEVNQALDGEDTTLWLMDLSVLTAPAALGLAYLTAAHAGQLPALVRAAGFHSAATGLAVAVASSSTFHRRCLGLFGKDPRTGRIPLLRFLLLWPYHLGVRCTMLAYQATSREELCSKVADRLYLGAWPRSRADLPAAAQDCAMLDATTALNPSRRKVAAAAYKPALAWETWGLEPAGFEEAVQWALAQQAAGCTVLVHCTHGHGRSAVAAAAVLIGAGQARDVDEALARVRAARPGASPNHRQVAQLRKWARARGGATGGGGGR